MPEQMRGVIISHTPLGEEYRELTVRARGMPPAEPGQFAGLKVSKTRDPLLRRPLSIYDQGPGDGMLRFLYRLAGKGTRLLADFREGEDVDLIAPLGRGFSLEGLTPKSRALLVAGGVGAAPLYFLARKLQEKKVPITFILGGQRAADLSFRGKIAAALGEGLAITTEDGSLGRRGLVTGPLRDLLGEKQGFNSLHIFACGPGPMLREVARLAREMGEFPLQVSLEAVMACGFGACLGCVCPAGREEGSEAYRRVCKEGPVFFAGEVEL